MYPFALIHGLGRERHRRRAGLLGLLCFVLVACTSGRVTTAEVSNLTIDELPVGLGRGYLVAGLDDVDHGDTGLEPGAQAPNFRLQQDDGRHFSLADLQGRPVLLNFWATWCTPCRQEMPDLVKATTTNPQLVVLAVNVQEELAQIQAFAEEFQMTMPIVRDAEGDLRQAYGVKGMPTTIFIDKDGKIVAVWSGLLTPDLLQKFLAEVE